MGTKKTCVTKGLDQYAQILLTLLVLIVIRIEGRDPMWSSYGSLSVDFIIIHKKFDIIFKALCV